MRVQRVLAALLLAAPLGRAEVFATPEEALARAFPGADAFERKLVLPSADQRTDLERREGVKGLPAVFAYHIARAQGRVIGYGVADRERGKHEPIDFLLAVNDDLSVRAVEILAYRESQGGEVRRASWRRQFEGKDPHSPLRVGQDVTNIAGATISCRAIADGVRRDLALLDVLVGAATPAPVPVPASAPRPRGDAGHVVRVQYLMGTTLRIEACPGESLAAEPALAAAFAEVARLEGLLSTWNEATPAARLNRAAGGTPQVLPAELCTVLGAALDVSRETAGAFDVTVGPVVGLWRAAAERGTRPEPEDLAAARARIGWRGIELDRERCAARLAREGMRIDLGAVGKGFALDAAARALEEHGVHRALLDFGGQLLALDPPPGAAAWPVAVRDPRQPERTLAVVDLVRASIASTADYERGWILAGERVSHVVDPRSGEPAAGMLGATVITPDATTADALSTALFVLGPQAALQHARKSSLAVLLVDAAGAVVTTPQFAARAHGEREAAH